MKRYEGEGIKVFAFKRGGYFVLHVRYLKRVICATKKHGEYEHELWWTDYERKFESRESGIRYFGKIKESNPSLKLVSDEPNKWMDSEGKVHEF